MNIKFTAVFQLNLEFQWHRVPPPGSDILTGYFHLISTGNGLQTASYLHQLLNDYGSCGMKLASPQPGAPDCGLRDQYPTSLNQALISRYSQTRWTNKSRSRTLLFLKKEALQSSETFVPTFHTKVSQLKHVIALNSKQRAARTCSVESAAHYIYHENRNTSN
jgi:hypothetical protein